MVSAEVLVIIVSGGVVSGEDSSGGGGGGIGGGGVQPGTDRASKVRQEANSIMGLQAIFIGQW